jgi:SAM-dependent methyltransferase
MKGAVQMGRDKHAEHMATNEKAWDAYQAFYSERLGPDYPEEFARGKVALEEAEVRLAGDVAGLTVLDTCCSSWPDDVFSFENLGAAKAIGCDLTPTAIAIARHSAARINSRAEFFQCDSQELAPIADESIDLVYGQCLCWLEDIEQTMRSWFRVTKQGGRLLISIDHPVTGCLEATGDGYHVTWKYDDESPEYGQFTGTPAAEGRWRGPYLPCVEFHHPTWRIVNAIVAAGYQLLRMEEACLVDEGRHPDLPNWLYLLARKPEEGP